VDPDPQPEDVDETRTAPLAHRCTACGVARWHPTWHLKRQVLVLHLKRAALRPLRMAEPSPHATKYAARTLAAMLADRDTELNRFVVGTATLQHTNELHVLVYDEEANDLASERVYSHEAGEIWHIAPCPADATRAFTVFNSGAEGFGAALWAMGESEGGGEGDGEYLALEELTRLPRHEGRIQCVQWHPDEAEAAVLSVDEGAVRRWSLGAGAAQESASKADLGGEVSVACWDPHHFSQLALGVGGGVQTLDLRSMKGATRIAQCHPPCVRDIDYNPNKPHHIVTGGDDYMVCFWDLRKCNQPLQQLDHHSHWVWSVKYNRFHDQLVLSGSTDGAVCLWNAVSISSDPPRSNPYGVSDSNSDAGGSDAGGSPASSSLDFDMGGGNAEKNADGLVHQYSYHDESVYAVAWFVRFLPPCPPCAPCETPSKGGCLFFVQTRSVADPWLMASVSYDGRIMANLVPQSLKDGILYG